MIPRILYGVVAKFNAGVINRFTPYRTFSRKKSLPKGTILWDLYTRYALEDITDVPRNVKKDCITFTTYRSIYYNRTRFWQPDISEFHFKEKSVV